MTCGISSNCGAAIDEAAEANATDNAIECSPAGRLQSRDQIECTDPCCFLAVGEIVINPDAADVSDLAIPFADLSGKENEIPDATERDEIGDRNRDTRQFDRECRKPRIDRGEIGDCRHQAIYDFDGCGNAARSAADRVTKPNRSLTL